MEEQKVNNETENEQSSLIATRWIGIIAIILFFVFDGWKVCPWYMWITFGLLALITFAGTLIWGQAILGVAVLIWGTTLFMDDDRSYNNESSGYESEAYGSGSNSDLSRYAGKWRLFQVGNGPMQTATFNITISANGDASIDHYAQTGTTDTQLEKGEGRATLYDDILYIEITRGKSRGTTLKLYARNGTLCTLDGQSFSRQ